MSTPTHVVLGGTGAVGSATVRGLLARGITPLTVSRHPPQTVPSPGHPVPWTQADMLDPAEAHRVLEGADIAYVAVGLPFVTQVWAEQWPIIIKNVSDAALAQGTHLIYLDSAFSLGRSDGPMTEQTPVNPACPKGEICAQALTILEEAAARGLSLTITRSADPYGGREVYGAFTTLALAKIARRHPGVWMIDADQPHSLSYVADIGNALALVGTTPAARGRLWHLPTAPALTGRRYIEIAAQQKGRINVMSADILRIGSVFDPEAREVIELIYEYEAPYIFDSQAFESEFGVSPTPYDQGIPTALASWEQDR